MIDATGPGLPPTTGGAMAVPTRPTTWPAVVGTISIVLGSLGVFGGLCGLASLPFMDSFAGFMSNVPGSSVEALMENMKAFVPALLAVNIVGMVVASLLLVWGILLVRRHRRARRLALTWAVLRLLFAIPKTAIDYLLNEGNMAAIKNDPQMQQAMQVMPAGFMESMSMLGVCVGVFIAITYPIFTLIWFNRSKIREEMAGWE